MKRYYQPRLKVTCCPLLEYFIPYKNYSGSVVCFHGKGYGLGKLIDGMQVNH